MTATVFLPAAMSFAFPGVEQFFGQDKLLYQIPYGNKERDIDQDELKAHNVILRVGRQSMLQDRQKHS
jgi:hypothetical protein